MPTPPFLGHATPSGSIVQHSQGLNSREDCHLEHRHCTAASGYGSSTIDARESQRLEPPTGDNYAVSVFELSSSPIILAPLLARSSSLVGNLSGEPDSTQVALSLGYVTGQNKASIDSPLADRTHGYGDMQDHASNYIIPPYAIEQSSGCPQESGDVSTFGDLDNNFARHTMYLGPIPSLHDCTSGQVTGSDAPLPRLSNPLLPSFQELHPSDDFTTGNIPPQPEQIQAEFERICPWTPFPSTYPIPSESNSLSYSVFDGYVPFFPMLNRNSSSWSPQEHLGYPISIHPHYTTPVDLPGFHEFDTGSKMELHTLGILGDNYAAQALGDRPSRTPPDYKAHPFCDYATYIPDDHTIGGGVDDYGNFDESKFNSEQVVGLRPQLPLPPNQLPLSPRDLHSYDRVSHIEGGSLSRTFHHRRRSATTRSRLPTRLPKVRLVCCHNVPIPCGWRDDQGRECGMPVNCGNRADHFAAAHGIKKKAWYFKITCRWCPSELPMEVVRKNFSRHVKEVHLGCPRSERGI